MQFYLDEKDPLSGDWDDVPVDLSFIYEDEKPAGRHSFLRVKEDKFVFEDGTEARFWGTNFNSGLNFPNYDFSEKIAKRLAKIGVNMVRFHQMDAEWATPNIFQFAKGRRKGNTLDFDTESMKRLDYLIYCLKKEGIYIYMDLLTYRKFKSGDGVENAFELADAAKPCSIFNRRLIELQKKYNYDLWTHKNPYTGFAYKDEPAVVLTGITNENDLFNRSVTIEPYKSELIEMYRKWSSEKGKEPLKGEIDFSLRENESITEFLMSVQEEYYREMTEHMRSIGVKIPVAGNNYAGPKWWLDLPNRKTQMVTDFSDGHTYWYDWSWMEGKKKFGNSSMVTEADSVLPNLSICRLPDRPFFVSEWDDPWPNEWRAESPLYMAAVGLLQEWSGFAVHTYSYSTKKDIDITGKEVSSRAIGSVSYREGVFNTWNDPAKFGLFYHAALMYRRKDVKPAVKSVDIKVGSLNTKEKEDVSALSLSSEKHRVGMLFDGCESNADEVVLMNHGIVDKSKGDVISDTGQLYRSWEKGIGWIDTDRTKVVYGFLNKEGVISFDSMDIDVKTDFATLAVSSLTDKPIRSSDNMLLTAVGRSENTGMKFNEEHNEMLDIGKPPILIEVIEAEIHIKTEVKTLNVWAVNAEGFYAGKVPSQYNHGVFSFRIGECFKSMYYQIQAE
jgi:hypothetical protein